MKCPKCHKDIKLGEEGNWYRCYDCKITVSKFLNEIGADSGETIITETEVENEEATSG
jgi:hypothetical protein